MHRYDNTEITSDIVIPASARSSKSDEDLPLRSRESAVLVVGKQIPLSANQLSKQKDIIAAPKGMTIQLETVATTKYTEAAQS